MRPKRGWSKVQENSGFSEPVQEAQTVGDVGGVEVEFGKGAGADRFQGGTAEGGPSWWGVFWKERTFFKRGRERDWWRHLGPGGLLWGGGEETERAGECRTGAKPGGLFPGADGQVEIEGEIVQDLEILVGQSNSLFLLCSPDELGEEGGLIGFEAEGGGPRVGWLVPRWPVDVHDEREKLLGTAENVSE